jgi:hypothetical protein
MNTPKNETIILSRRVKDPFAKVNKKMLDDPNISFQAKGILAYLLGKPDGWKLRVGDLRNHAVDGRDSIRRALNELRMAGYAKYEQTKENNRFSSGVWKICDIPIFSPRPDFPAPGIPAPGNQSLSKNDCTKNDCSLKGSKDDTIENGVHSNSKNSEEHNPVWKPDLRGKEEKLKRIKPPKDFPTEVEFDQFISDEDLGNLANHRPDLYKDLCIAKWQQWKKEYRRWVPIKNWKSYVIGLDDAIAGIFKSRN